MRLTWGLGAAALALAGCDAATTAAMPDVAIGLNRPAPGLHGLPSAMERRFAWSARPGASAYLVVVSTDRGGADPVASSGFTAATMLPATALAWRELHPLADRAYFWTVRAYDRPDPQGLLLARSEPREFRPARWEAEAWWVDGPSWP